MLLVDLPMCAYWFESHGSTVMGLILTRKTSFMSYDTSYCNLMAFRAEQCKLIEILFPIGNNLFFPTREVDGGKGLLFATLAENKKQISFWRLVIPHTWFPIGVEHDWQRKSIVFNILHRD